MNREQPIELFMPPNMLKAKALAAAATSSGLDLAATVGAAEAAMEAIKSELGHPGRPMTWKN